MDRPKLLQTRAIASGSTIAGPGNGRVAERLQHLSLVQLAGSNEGGKTGLIERSAQLDFAELGRLYRSAISSYGLGAQGLINKTPLNFLYLGLIHLALPEAKVVHLRRAEALGRRLRRALQATRPRCPALVELRGLGSMLAAELDDPATGKSSAEIAKRVQQRALEKGLLLLLSCEMHGNVIRFLYPLTIPDAQLDAAIDTLSQVLLDLGSVR